MLQILRRFAVAILCLKPLATFSDQVDELDHYSPGYAPGLAWSPRPWGYSPPYEPAYYSPYHAWGPEADGFPHAFHVFERWPYLRGEDEWLPSRWRTRASSLEDLAKACINMRGAVRAERPPTKWFEPDGLPAADGEGVVEAIFNRHFGGVQRFYSPMQIMLELKQSGPVVVTNFCAAGAVSHSGPREPDAGAEPQPDAREKKPEAGRGEDGAVWDRSCGQAALIVGWRGAAWNVIAGKFEAEVPFVQLPPDGRVIGPRMDMSQLVWQHGPKWQCTFPDSLEDDTGPWWTWAGMRITSLSDDSMQELCRLCISSGRCPRSPSDDCDIFALKGFVVVRHPWDFPSRSRRYRITAVTMDTATKKFDINTVKVSDQWS